MLRLQGRARLCCDFQNYDLRDDFSMMVYLYFLLVFSLFLFVLCLAFESTRYTVIRLVQVGHCFLVLLLDVILRYRVPISRYRLVWWYRK